MAYYGNHFWSEQITVGKLIRFFPCRFVGEGRYTYVYDAYYSTTMEATRLHVQDTVECPLERLVPGARLVVLNGYARTRDGREIVTLLDDAVIGFVL
uniref:Phage protein n=1 Tax=Steinernema glaseri TaxID=37863 RepID=A0A1I8AQG2_9BILA